MSNVKGYKVFNPDWTCRGFQYEVGKKFKHEGDISVCNRGFHFCQKASDCFNYYNFDSKNKVAEVIATGRVETKNDKSVTDEITIIREIPWSELLTIVNEGKNCNGINNVGDNNVGSYNVGDKNVGDENVRDRNIGIKNVGYYNVGDNNVGDFNVGNGNLGDGNVGHRNVGSGNKGNRNTGDFNVGYCNVGDWNIINYSTGVFNTEQKTIDIFDKPSNWTFADWLCSDVRSILKNNFELTTWIYEEDMTDEEKEQHPEYKTTGGYLKVFEFKEACKNMWNNLTDNKKHKVITGLPNFDAEKFEKITGINVKE